MIVNDVTEFQKLVLMCGLRENATGELREILDCIQFYAGMCGCNGEAKNAKYTECNQRYYNFVRNNLKSISDEILKYESSVIFNHDGVFMTFISK